MRYTEAQRQAIHKALVAAKPLLASSFNELYNIDENQHFNKAEYICHAVQASVHGAASWMTRYMITERLDPFSSLSDWLAHRPEVGYSVYQRTPEMITRIQQHRHAWLDKLIREFSK